MVMVVLIGRRGSASAFQQQCDHVTVHTKRQQGWGMLGKGSDRLGRGPTVWILFDGCCCVAERRGSEARWQQRDHITVHADWQHSVSCMPGEASDRLGRGIQYRFDVMVVIVLTDRRCTGPERRQQREHVPVHAERQLRMLGMLWDCI